MLQHDDTTMRILDLRPVALYFTGWQHAGENLAAVLRQRAADLAPPIQMCDALSRNLHPESNTVGPGRR